jgi:hypothetical protein
MTDKKLTPRVGDRVTLRLNGRTYAGTVQDRSHDASGEWLVSVDGRGRGFYASYELTVVDRDPVEWPEGWSDDGYGHAYHEPSNCDFERDGLEQVLATGPDMLARWGELMGGDA